MHKSEKLLGRMNTWLRILKHSLQCNKKIGIQEIYLICPMFYEQVKN